jgi:uncharacterized protein YecE (DUF72 family)
MLRIGTCSWKYPSWKGLVYSRATGIDYLAEYATRCNTVEVDQWFWALPEPVIAEQYASVTPADFRFTVKLPNSLTLTHLYPTKAEPALRPNPQFLSVPLFQDVLARLQPLHQRIGMLMLQLQGYFMPPIFETWGKYGSLVRDSVVVRLQPPKGSSNSNSH